MDTVEERAKKIFNNTKSYYVKKNGTDWDEYNPLDYKDTVESKNEEELDVEKLKKELERTLKAHAKTIQGKAQSPRNVTILCAAIAVVKIAKDSKIELEQIELNAFTSKTLWSDGERKKAKELEYEPIPALKQNCGHAEAKLIQYLFFKQMNDESSPVQQKILIAEGCSRPICRSCDLMFEMAFNNYNLRHKALKWDTNPVLEKILQTLGAEIDKKEHPSKKGIDQFENTYRVYSSQVKAPELWDSYFLGAGHKSQLNTALDGEDEEEFDYRLSVTKYALKLFENQEMEDIDKFMNEVTINAYDENAKMSKDLKDQPYREELIKDLIETNTYDENAKMPQDLKKQLEERKSLLDSLLKGTDEYNEKAKTATLKQLYFNQKDSLKEKQKAAKTELKKEHDKTKLILQELIKKEMNEAEKSVEEWKKKNMRNNQGQDSR